MFKFVEKRRQFEAERRENAKKIAEAEKAFDKALNDMEEILDKSKALANRVQQIRQDVENL